MKHLILLLIMLGSYSAIEFQPSSAAEKELPESKISEIRNFIRGKKYNQDLAVFINFKIHSRKYRYFVYDLRNDKVVQQAIVAHGEGSVIGKSGLLKFSNTEGLHQSSLGKYEIRESYSGKFGKAYRLDGLDETNSNARKRAIVLHAFSCIPDKESAAPACLSFGCPMLSKNALQQTARYIDQSKQPVILYAFY